MKILALSVHPDDETLGCGGTLLKHHEAGDRLDWLVITRTAPPEWEASLVEAKEREVARVAEAYNMEEVYRLNFLPKHLDHQPQSDLIDGIRGAIAASAPDVVYMIHRGDIHTDHRATFSATMSVLKTFYMKSHGVKRVLSYETLSSTDAAPPNHTTAFLPTVYSEITAEQVDRKIEIMSLFDTEVHSDPFPRGPSAIRALARLRGAHAGVEYAEAFTLVREVF